MEKENMPFAEENDTEREKQENIWRRKIYIFMEDKKPRRKREKLEKKSINFCGGEKTEKVKGKKLERKIFISEKENENGEEKEENIWVSFCRAGKMAV